MSMKIENAKYVLYKTNPFFPLNNTIGFCLFQLGSNLSHFGSISSFEDVGTEADMLQPQISSTRDFCTECSK